MGCRPVCFIGQYQLVEEIWGWERQSPPPPFPSHPPDAQNDTIKAVLRPITKKGERLELRIHIKCFICIYIKQVRATSTEKTFLSPLSQPIPLRDTQAPHDVWAAIPPSWETTFSLAHLLVDSSRGIRIVPRTPQWVAGCGNIS